jgi:hypothetical protein
MIILVKGIGIFITAMGVMILVNPRFAKGMMAFWRKGNKVYLAALIRLILGAIFVYSAPKAGSPKMLYVLGILMLLGGALIFVLGSEKANAMIDWWGKQPEHYLRLLSLLALVFGGLILYSA